MPVAAETLRNTRHLNLWFAASAVVAAASVLWMLRDDHVRPWRDIQHTDFDNQSALAHFDVLELTSATSKAHREQLAAKLSEAREQAKKHADRESRFVAEQKDKSGRLQGAAASFGNLNAEFQVTLFHYEEAKTLHGEGSAQSRKAKEHVDHQKKELDRLRLAKEKLEDELAVIAGELKKLREPVERASKELAAFDKKVADAKQRETMYAAGLVSYRTMFNAPGLDFVAPKGTPGREEIKQIVLPDVRQNYNFLDSYTVDRCTTCHLAIDQPGATQEEFVARAEKALRVVNERRVAEGRSPIKVERRKAKAEKHDPHAAVAAEPEHRAEAKPGAAGQPEGATDFSGKQYAEMDAAQRRAYRDGLEDALNEYLGEQGKAPVKLGQPLWSHPRLDLFVSADSPHPISKMGCTSCHEGNGQETDFMYAAHSPSTHAQEHEWAEKYYVKTWGIPQATFHLIEEYWDRPMMPAKFTQATCSKCHTEISDLASARGDSLAPKLTEGRKLFTQLGCINCHLVEGLGDSRRVGPDLTHVSEKLDKGFIEKWVWYPRDFRPSTLMPHFFRQENQQASSRNEDDPEPMLRNETEVQAITHYLQTFSTPFQAEPLPAGKSGDAKRGWEKFTSVGCLACHGGLGVVDPSDDKGRTYGKRWIETDLVKSGLKADEAKARVAGMTLNQQTDYAMQHFTAERHADAMRKLNDMRARGEDISSLYVPPEFTRFAPDLSGIGSKLAPHANRTERGRLWLFNWLKDPNHYHAGSKMPRLFKDNYYWQEQDAGKRGALAEQDILDVTEYLLSLRHDSFEQKPFAEDDKHRAMTRKLVLATLAGQYTDAAAAMILEDRKTSAGDAMGQMSAAIVKQVEKSIGRAEATARVLAMDLEQRQKLFLGVKMIGNYGCSACHTIAGFENATRPGTELTYWGEKFLSQLDFAFFSPGFEDLPKKEPERFATLYPTSSEFEHLVAGNGNEPQEITHSRAAFAYHKLRNPRIWDRGKIKKAYDKLKMPNFFLSPSQAESIVTFLLSRVHSRVTPAVQVDYGRSSLGGIAAGRHLVNELNCTACHRIEDNEPVVQQYGLVEDPSGGVMVDELNLPPWLHGQGAKIGHGWLKVFLQQVEMLRPWLKIRMPSFHLEDWQAQALVKYFASVSQKESADVRERLELVHGYRSKAKAAAPPSTQPVEAGQGPGDDWHVQADLKSVKQFAAEYGVRYRLAQPSALNEKDNDAAALASTYTNLLEAEQFLSDLYKVDYPFVESPRPMMSAERFKLGEQMFLEMKCLSCHVLGDQGVKGANPNPSAPNLALTHQRLRRTWVQQWLQYPNRIQPGTKMPQWWGHGGSLAQFPPEDYKAFADKYGATHEAQLSLMLDYLYEAGARNHTVIDPEMLAPPPAETPAEEGPSDMPDDLFGDTASSAPAEKKDEKKEEEKPADDFVP